MKHVVTDSGFEAEIDEGCFDDMELLEDIMGAQQGNALTLPSIAGKLLGNQKGAFYDHCRDESGRVPTGRAMTEMLELIRKARGKNS